MKRIIAVYGFGLGFLVCYLMLSTGGAGTFDAVSKQAEVPESGTSMYLSFMAVMLTAVTVVLASVAIAVGFFALYTRKEIKEAAQDMATKTVAEALAVKLSDEAIKDRIDSVAFSALSKRALDQLDEDFDLDDSGER